MGIDTTKRSRIDTSSATLEINSATGTKDLFPQLSELVIFENLFQPTLTATLVLKEAHNLPYKLPIVGEETINIDIGIKDFLENKLRVNPPPFHVNSIKNRGPITPKSQLLVLTLVSEKFMSNSHAKVSRSYKNKRIDEIVGDIHNTYLDDGSPLFVEPTDRIERCIIPNMSPINAITWLSSRAVPTNSNNNTQNVNYLFYETVRGSFFVTINSLLEKPTMLHIRKVPRVEDAESNIAFSEGKMNVEKISFLNTFDKFANTKRGVYASKLITHDIVKKKITQHESNYLLDWASSSHLGKHPPISGADVETKSASANRTSFAPPKDKHISTTDQKLLTAMVDSKVEFYPKHDKMYSTWTGDLYDNKVEDWKLQRNSIGLFQNLRIYVEGKGVSSLRVGNIVELKVPSPESTEGDKMSDVGHDKALSGRYIVTAIKHIFAERGEIEYRMGIELAKDGFEDVVPFRPSRKED